MEQTKDNGEESGMLILSPTSLRILREAQDIQTSTPCIAVVFAQASWGGHRERRACRDVVSLRRERMCQVSMQRRFGIDCPKRTSSLIPSPTNARTRYHERRAALQHASSRRHNSKNSAVARASQMQTHRPALCVELGKGTCHLREKRSKSSVNACILYPLLRHTCLSAHLPKHRLVHHDVEWVHQNPSGAKRVELRRNFPPGDSCTYNFR